MGISAFAARWYEAAPDSRLELTAILAEREAKDTRRDGIQGFGSLSPDGTNPTYLGSTNDEGKLSISFDRLPLWVWFESVDHLSYRYQFEVPTSPELIERNIQLLRTSPASIYVSSLGAPIAGAEVAVLRSVDPLRTSAGENVRHPLPKRRHTDSNGKAALRRIPGPSPTQIGVWADGYAPAFASVEAGQNTTALELAPPSSLTVQLLRDDGSPAAGATTTLDLPSPAPRLGAMADERGRATWPDLPSSGFLLRAELDGASDSLSGELSGSADFATLRLASTNSITGRLVGFPSSNTWTVTLVATGSHETDAQISFPHLLRPAVRSRVVSSNEGFRFTDCRRSSYELLVYAAGSNIPVAAASNVLAGSHPTPLAYCSDAPASGRLSGTLASPIPAEASLTVRPRAPLPATVVALDLRGRTFLSSDLLPGSYDLFVRTDLNEQWIATANILEGVVELGVVNPNPTGTIDLRARGTEVHSVTLSNAGFTGTWNLSDRASPWTFKLRDNRLSSVPAGCYELVATCAGKQDVHTSVTVHDGETTDIEIFPQTGRTIRLFVASERPLLPEETMTIRASNGISSTPVFVLEDRISRDRPSAVLIQRASIPRTAREVDIESSAGLRGHAVLAPYATRAPGDIERVDVFLR